VLRTKHQDPRTKNEDVTLKTMKITRFEEIEAWQIGRDLSQFVYRVVKKEKFSKDYGLKDQVCRASVSIMANIAEGFDSGSRAEFARFLAYAQRSCSELQSEIYVALDQDYITKKEFDEIYSLASKVKSKIGAFIKYLKQRTQKPRTKVNQEP
jgi:four helix bundle protein